MHKFIKSFMVRLFVRVGLISDPRVKVVPWDLLPYDFQVDWFASGETLEGASNGTSKSRNLSSRSDQME
jgi:hypothetical protein